MFGPRSRAFELVADRRELELDAGHRQPDHAGARAVASPVHSANGARLGRAEAGDHEHALAARLDGELLQLVRRTAGRAPRRRRRASSAG